MGNKARLRAIALVSFCGAIVFTLSWLIISSFSEAPKTYQLDALFFTFTINRWWDAVLLPLALAIMLALDTWLSPTMSGRADQIVDAAADFCNAKIGIITKITAVIIGVVAALILKIGGLIICMAFLFSITFGALLGVGNGLLMSTAIATPIILFHFFVSRLLFSLKKARQ